MAGGDSPPPPASSFRSEQTCDLDGGNRCSAAAQSLGTQGRVTVCLSVCLASFPADLCLWPGFRRGPGRRTHLWDRPGQLQWGWAQGVGWGLDWSPEPSHSGQVINPSEPQGSPLKSGGGVHSSNGEGRQQSQAWGGGFSKTFILRVTRDKTRPSKGQEGR